jgi:2-iminobutanoate/2-iminopropanoate deaminase
MFVKRKSITAEGIRINGPYSHAVDAGDLVYLSGQTPLDPKTGKIVEGDIAAQIEQAFCNAFAVLKSADMSPDNVIKVNVYMTDLSNISIMNGLYSEKFSAPYPARTTIGVKELPSGSKVELEMVAKKGI